MGQNARDVILDEFANVVDDMFSRHADLKFTTAIADPNETAEKIRSEIGFGSEMLTAAIGLEGSGVRCTLSLLGGSSTISRLGSSLITDQQDWIGEIANLLMGALKNNLSEYNVSTRIGLPVSVRGDRIELVNMPNEKSAFIVNMEFGTVLVVLHYGLDVDAEWEHDPNMLAASEGEVCLF